MVDNLTAFQLSLLILTFLEKFVGSSPHLWVCLDRALGQ